MNDERENNSEDLRKSIEKHKQEVLDKIRQEKEEENSEARTNHIKSDRGMER